MKYTLIKTKRIIGEGKSVEIERKENVSYLYADCMLNKLHDSLQKDFTQHVSKVDRDNFGTELPYFTSTVNGVMYTYKIMLDVHNFMGDMFRPKKQFDPSLN